VGRARRAVLDGTFGELSAEVARTWGQDLPVVEQADLPVVTQADLPVVEQAEPLR
jgi:hypothetical protein